MKRTLGLLLSVLLLMGWAMRGADADVNFKPPGAASSISPGAYPLLAPNGTVTAPSYSWSNDTDTGFYYNGSGTQSFSSNNARQFDLTTGGIVMISGNNMAFNGTGGGNNWVTAGIALAAQNTRDLQVATTQQGNKQFWYFGAKSLTESSATSVVRVGVAASAKAGGEIRWTVDADDATDFQSRAGRGIYAVVNKGGTETCTFTDDALSQVAVSAGTLTCTVACDTTPTNAVDLQFNCTSSLTQTTLAIRWTLDLFSSSNTSTITPQ